jgi:hypothetical protein
MATKTADQASAKWLANLSSSQSEMQAGVAAVTQAPGALAAAKVQKWQNALNDPATVAKWVRNVQAGGSLSAWQAAMENYGISRAIQGAQQKQAKYTNAMSSVLPYIYTLRQQVRSMDDSTPAAREARMLAFVRGMRQYKRPATQG